MRPLFVLLLLLPLVSPAQKSAYVSADVLAHVGKDLDNVGYGVGGSANIGLTENILLGGSIAGFRMASFLQNISIPINLRATFFADVDEDRILPFGLLEFGKIFYKQETQMQDRRQDLRGQFNLFAGIGVRFPSQSRLHPTLSMGYSALLYRANEFSTNNTLLSQQNFNLKRVTVRAGFIIPRKKLY